MKKQQVKTPEEIAVEITIKLLANAATFKARDEIAAAIRQRDEEAREVIEVLQNDCDYRDSWRIAQAWLNAHPKGETK